MNWEKYDAAYLEAFDLPSGTDVKTLAYQSIEAWDSVGHMTLIAILEDTFDIMLDTDDVIDFASYEIGKEIIKKYGIEL